MIRKVDDLFLAKLKENMEKTPNGSYEPLYLSVKNIQNKQEFSPRKVNDYKYEVLGGTHNVLATKDLKKKAPRRHSVQCKICQDICWTKQ